MTPMLLLPAEKDYLWGGDRLITEYNKHAHTLTLAETWECSVHPDGLSIINSGEYKGNTLKDVLAAHPEFIGTKSGSDFPILVKFIDARANLSIQVHPDDEYALKNEQQKGKTEMWYVLSAEPGAQIIYGFQHNTNEKQIRDEIASGSFNNSLQTIQVHKGDVFYIPAGTIHAVGAGIVIAEIQENSNVTYRLYDYDRIDKNGNRRELNIEKAFQVINMKPGPAINRKPRKIVYSYGYTSEILCRCKYFETEKIVSSLGFDTCVTEKSFLVLLCLEGEGRLTSLTMPKPLFFRKGDCIFIPAGKEVYHILGKNEMLKIRC